MKPITRTGLIARLIALALALTLIAAACGDSDDSNEAQTNSRGEESDESSDDDAAEEPTQSSEPDDSGSENCAAESTFDAGDRADEADLELNETVSGEIAPYTADVWLVELCAGQILFLDGGDECVGDGGLYWNLYDPDGTSVYDIGDLLGAASGAPHTGECGGSGGPIEIASSGTHALDLRYSEGADDGYEATYAFTLLEVPATEQYPLALGQTVSPDNPAPGAGALTVPGERDEYVLDLNAGDELLFEPGDFCSGDGDLAWRLYDSDDNELPGGRNDLLGATGAPFRGECQHDPVRISIVSDGEHTLSVYYRERSEGTADAYSFTVTTL